MNASQWKLNLGGASIAAIALSILAAPAAAQQQSAGSDGQAPESDESAAASDEIVVTGSRIPRAGFTAPTPVTVVAADQLAKAAPSTLAESLRQLPALTNTSGPQRNSGSQRAGQSFLNLRSLGANRTLTLIGGRRIVSTSLTGSVDANIIPAGVVQRVEIVTGGASAAYGSDAVAGVVNFLLDSDFRGIKGEANYGVAQEGDNQEYRATLSAGIGFANDRGHILLSGEYFRNDGVAPGARPWASQGWGLVNNPSAPPTLVLQPDVRAVGTHGGLIITGNGGTAANNALFRGIQFLPGGVPAPYSFGTFTTTSQQVGGDGVRTELIQEINRPLERGSAFGHVSFDLTDDFTVFAEAIYGQSASTVNNTWNRRQNANPFTIQRDNAFLPETIRTQMTTAGVTSLTMLRFSRERGYIVTTTDSETTQGTIGLTGNIGSLELNAHYSHGRTTQDNDVQNDEITARFNAGIDSVLVTAANVGTSGLALGSIACRSTLTAPTNGCVPFNVFGEGAPSEAAMDYARGTSSSDAVIEADMAGITLAGTLFEGWAGPVGFAVGGEYRSESVNLTTDPLSPTGAFLLGNPNPWSGEYTVKEGFAEVVVPLLQDLPLVEEFELNAAGRITDYSTSGTVETWKIGVSWSPVADLRFRGTRSRDIRAPNLAELFQAGRQSIASVNDPFKANVRVTGIPQINSGNATLTPEIADTLTLGAVYSPSWATGLNFSVDYYDIKIDDAIDNIGAQTAVDQCFLGVTAACDLFTRDANNNITRFTALPINLASAKTRGIDFELGYSAGRGILGLEGNLSVRAIASYLDKQETTTPGGAPVDRAGEAGVSANPRWRGISQVNYQGDVFGAFMQVRYVGSGAYDLTRGPAVVDLQRTPSRTYLDGQVSAMLPIDAAEIEVFLNVRNIFNTAPPIAPENANVPVAFNAFLHDVIGRTFRFGAKFKF